MDLSRLEELFHRCLELSPSEREAFLERECDGSPELADRVRNLLGHSENSAAPSLSPLVDRPLAAAAPTSLVGQSLGGYEVERPLASGGMGQVFTAIQRSTKRRVALKTLKPELMGASLVRRFSLEVEVLGRLHHANIAQVFDGGTETIDSATIPYFAMEYVPNAVPIHRYAREHDLAVARTVQLFAKACRGVEHAHRQGVIHRDLKPENILVDGEDDHAEPKVIDFGIARFSEEGEAATLLTSPGQILGTLATMSPEQARGAADEIDVRTDVYALGAVLYQMLTGETPLTVKRESIPEALRTILEDVPENPSKRRDGIRPELDAIVMKCLAKERDARYESVRALLDDLSAFTEGRTVSARAPTTIELLRINARRHRAILIPAAVVFVVAIAAAVISTRFAMQARERAVEVEQRSDEVSRLAYQASLSAAVAALEDSETQAARGFLEEAPGELRGWEWHHLSSRLEEEIATFDADRGTQAFAGIAVAEELYATGEQYYATVASSDSSVSLWDARTGELLWHRELDGFPYQVDFRGGELSVRDIDAEKSSLYRFSPEGNLLERRRLPETMSQIGGGEGVQASAIGRDRVAYLRLKSGELFVYDVERDSVIAHREVGRMVLLGDLSPDGRSVALAEPGATEGSIEILSVPELTRSRTLDGIGEFPYPIRFSPSGRWLVAMGSERGVFVWDLESGSSRPLYRLEMTEAAGVVAISDDERLLAVSTADRKVSCFALESGAPIVTFSVPAWKRDPGAPAGRRNRRTKVAVMEFRPGTHELYTAPEDGPIQVWDLSRENPRRLARHASYVYSAGMVTKGGLVLSAGWDGYAGSSGCLRWTDLATGESVAELGPPSALVFAAAVSKDESEALVSLTTWRAGSGDGRQGTTQAAAAEDPLLAPDDSGLLARISMRTGEILGRHEFPKSIEYLDVDPDYDRAVVSNRYGNTRVLRIDSGEILHETGEVWATQRDGAPVAWSSDGRWIAVARGHRRVEIWDAQSYEVVGASDGHHKSINSVAFDPQNERILTSSADQVVKVWSVPECELLAELEGHGAEVLCAKFHPDGSRIVSGGRGGEFRSWDGETYDPVVSMTLHDSYIYDLTWADDGETLVTASGDGTVGVWEAVPPRVRYAAQDERAEIAERVTPAIEAAFATGASPTEIWQRLVTNPEAPSREEQVIWQEILRRAVGASEEEEPSPSD